MKNLTKELKRLNEESVRQALLNNFRKESECTRTQLVECVMTSPELVNRFGFYYNELSLGDARLIGRAFKNDGSYHWVRVQSTQRMKRETKEGNYLCFIEEVGLAWYEDAEQKFLSAANGSEEWEWSKTW